MKTAFFIVATLIALYIGAIAYYSRGFNYKPGDEL